MAKFSVKVRPDGDGDKDLMEAFHLYSSEFKSFVCRLGEIFNKPYDEYLIEVDDDSTFAKVMRSMK